MDQKVIATGLVSALIGFGLGIVAAPSAPKLSEIGDTISEKLAPSAEANESLAKLVGDLDAKMDGLSERLDGLEETVSASSAKDAVSELGSKIETLSSDVATSLESTAASLGEQLSALSVAGSSPVKAAPEGITPGMTAVFNDGAVRAFVSRVDDNAVALSLNGAAKTLAVGGSTKVDDCQITLDAVDRGHAVLSAACGEGASDEKVALSGNAETYGIGKTAILGDGAARIYVSGVDTETNSARLAVKGLKLETYTGGSKIELDGSDCVATVEAVSAGAVSLGYLCE